MRRGRPGDVVSSATHVVAALAAPSLLVATVLAAGRRLAFGSALPAQHPDVLAFWLPTYCFLGRSIRAGEVPTWNPHVMGGAPFASDPQSGWLSLVPMALFATAACADAMRWTIVLHPLIAALGLYAFLRAEGVTRSAAVVGGLAIALPLASVRLALFVPFPAAIAWTAVLLAACARYVRAATGSARVLWAAAAALAWGQLAAAHAGHGLLLGSAAAGVYLVAAVGSRTSEGTWSLREARLRVASLLLLVPLVNLGWLLPRLAYLPRSSYGAAYGGRALGLDVAWPLQLAAAPGAHVAAVVLGLAFAGLWSRRRAMAAAFLTLAAAGYALSVLPVAAAVASVVRDVPVLDFLSHYPNRFGLALLVALPVLGALGVEAWLHAESWAARAAMAVPGVALWFALPPLAGARPNDLLLLAAGAVAAAAVLAVAASLPSGAARTIVAGALPVVVALELVANGLLAERRAPARAPSPDAAGTEWFVPLARPAVDPRAYLRPGPIARHLLGTPGGRFLTLAPERLSRRGYLEAQDRRDWGLLANQRSTLLGLEDAQGYGPFQLERYWRFVRSLTRRRLDYNAAVFDGAHPIVLNLLDVRWVVGPRRRPPVRGAVAVASEGPWRLYRLAPGPGRASLVSSWRPVDDAREALAVVTRGRFDPAGPALVEDPAGGAALVPPPPPSAERREGASRRGTAGEARRRRSRPPAAAGTAVHRAIGDRAARVAVRARRTSLLVVRNVHDPNWHATIDGRAAPVLAVDGLVQGVVVPAGRHTVRLVHRDPWIGRGLLGSLVVLTLLLIVGVRSAAVGGARATAARSGTTPS